jgi:3-oxoacyl-[acyl-carrier-protein] synthase II
MTPRAVTPLAVTGCGLVSHAGIGLGALADAMAGQPVSGSREVHEEFPPVPVAATPELPLEEHLGRKGLKSLDRTTQLSLLACAQAFAGLGSALTAAERQRTGVVVGTSTGSIRSSSEFSRETVVRDKPYHVRANLFPNSVMNCCASQIAIWNSVQGVNATVSGGRVSGLAAVRYARNAIDQGHVDRALVGAVEELCPQSAWAWYLSGALALGAPIGEGAAFFVMETPAAAAAAGRTPIAEVLACETAAPGRWTSRRALVSSIADCATRALERSGVRPESVGTACLGASGLVGLARAEEDGVRAALGRLPGRRLRSARLLGETFSASGALGMGMVLGQWRDEPGPDVALVTSVGQDCGVGCLVMRK